MSSLSTRHLVGRWLPFALGLFCTAVLAQAPSKPAASAPAAATVKWDLPNGYSADVFQTRNLVMFADDVRSSTKGRLDITVHPNNSLVKMAEIPAKVRAGIIPIGEVIMTSMTKDVPIAGADSVPFIVASYEDAQRLWKHQRPILDKALQAQGLIALYAVPWPPQGLYSVKPVRETKDLKGMKMRTYNPTTVRIAELLETRPVDVTFADVPKALAEGRIDTMLTSATTGVDSKAWNYMKYYLDIRAWFPKNMVMVNKAAFEALDEPLRNAVLAAAKKAEARGWELSKEAMNSATKELTTQGMRVDSASFSLRTQLRRHGEQFSIEWIRATGKDAGELLIPYFGSK